MNQKGNVGLEPNAQIELIKALAANSPHHNEVLRGALGYAYAAVGQRQRATEILHALTQPKTNVNKHKPYAIALVLIGLNQRQEAVKWLEHSYRNGSLWSLGFRSDPILAPLHNDPHYKLFMSRASYPVSENAHPHQKSPTESCG
ncbi:MAG: hypothetical protein ABSA48_16410 [Terracidiphilus sp.]|jgi:hypothetical protein